MQRAMAYGFEVRAFSLGNCPVGDHVIPLSVSEPARSEGALVLRAWERRDAEVVLAAGLDGLISRFRYSLPRTADAVPTWLAATRQERLAGTRLELAITEHGTPVGSVALVEIAHGNAEVRYWLLPPGRGRGLASTALRLLAGWAFSTLRLGRLAAFIEPESLASAAVLRRCGFVEEGRLRRQSTNHAGDRVDTLLYGLFPEAFRRERSAKGLTHRIVAWAATKTPLPLGRLGHAKEKRCERPPERPERRRWSEPPYACGAGCCQRCFGNGR